MIKISDIFTTDQITWLTSNDFQALRHPEILNNQWLPIPQKIGTAPDRNLGNKE